jgi:poly-gamma-glutamate capsule biosynthesis protein CapA/YwtB (metallophosphatase superfamily)
VAQYSPAGRNRSAGIVAALALSLVLFSGIALGKPGQPVFADTIENFDDGSVVLVSYPGEDVHPDSWTLDTLVTYHNSPYSLKLFGNTWKIEPIDPIRLDSGDVWQVAAYIGSLGEVQGFGLVDSTDTLLYSFAGTEEVDPAKWVTVYQGAFSTGAWNVYQLPVAEDWLARFGRLPLVAGIVFVNDRDTDPRAIVYFEEIADITGDLPVAPHVEIWYEAGDVFENADGQKSVTVQFHSRVTDPDSPDHDYFWYFGDDSTSRDSSPSHTYVIEDDHEYTVLLEVVDSTGQWGRATCEVTVDPGPTTFPVTMNFVGDIMLARGYENPGGIIDTLGVGGIFDPTLPYLGEAADITVANLESPLCSLGTRHPTKPIVFRGRPRNVAGLVHAGVDVVSLANNHVIDYGLVGLQQMQGVLAANHILFSGAGANSYEAYRPVFYQQSGLNIAFLASCDRNGQYDNYQPYLDAGFNKSGFAYLDSFHVRRQIEAVQGIADLTVVEMHTGEEYVPTPVDGHGNDRFPMANDRGNGDEWYSRLALFPAPGDTEERHRAIEAGADVVICHHPHMLQGFEVYQGKLIAHSLGDFVFDLSYAETYPSVILNAKVDQTGFHDYSLTPVYIDDWIPGRARGELGTHILDYLARRSKDLRTYVTVNRDSVTAAIVLDTTALRPVVNSSTDRLRLQEENGYWTSDPLRLPRNGCISSVVSITPPADWQFRLGRDVIWFGNFEDEGCTMWLLNQPDERYDTIPCRGRRSLRQTRAVGSGPIATNLENRMVCYSDSAHYTLRGHIKTQNARDAGAVVEFYTARTGSSPIGSSDLDTTVTGTTDWTFYNKEFVPANGTGYFDVSLESDAPQSGGDGLAWFDDVGIVEWEPWQSLGGPTSIPNPNDYYWVQVRTSTQTTDALLTYEETSYNSPVGLAGSPTRGSTVRRFRSYPNPAGAVLTLAYDLTGAARVTLRVYDVLGREVRTLVDRVEGRGTRQVHWDGRDNNGRTVPAGTFVCRLEAGGRVLTKKVVLSR